MSKNIAIILPYKESMRLRNAGAVSLFVKDSTKYSIYKDKVQIISSANINDNTNFFTNKKYIINFCKKFESRKFKIIEIHNRPEYVLYVKKYFPKTKIVLFFHNDPLTLRGSISLNQRIKIINNSHKIIFISRWIQQRFFMSIKNANIASTLIIPHGVEKIKKINISKKKKNILFVGKLNYSKGYHIFCETALKFNKIDPTWNFIAIGNEERKKIFPNTNAVKEIGFKKNSEVLEFYKKSEIAIGNSVWDEPLGRIAIEASSRKCLAIISNKGGLAESKNIALVLKENTSSELLKLLIKITQNKSFCRKKQNLFFNNNNFDIKKISKKLDFMRSQIIENKHINNIAEKKRILHLADFNENSDGRLYYSFANKLNNGFIKNNYIVQNLSDKYLSKQNKSMFKIFSSDRNFNNNILNTLKNFSPHILVIGHIFNIDNKVFLYCRENNIKICSWYIDSISPEFLKGQAKADFFRNLNFVDYCFLTSSPILFKKNKNFNKLRFIPNPSDSAIDHYKNFEKKDVEYDVFIAISHGQNRVILKKGKIDEREAFINKIIFNLSQLKFAQFGFNNFEPIWGANYYDYLSKSKMAINISRGRYQNKYSSDRISSLIGNGLLVFIDKKTKLNKIFSNKDVVFYNNAQDLISKLKYYKLNDTKRIKIAKSGYIKYHKHMSNIVIANYILSSVELIDYKKPFWHSTI